MKLTSIIILTIIHQSTSSNKVSTLEERIPEESNKVSTLEEHKPEESNKVSTLEEHKPEEPNKVTTLEEHKPEEPNKVPTLEEHQLEEIGGQFEGDIILPFNTLKNGLKNTNFRWPNGIVYYKIDRVFNSKRVRVLKKAMESIERATCIKFQKRRRNNKDYIYITGKNNGCYSGLGRIGGRQILNLQLKGCVYVGVVMHELLHSIGFVHQQSAADRDNYVQVVNENIEQGMQHNFKKYTPNYLNDFGISYDYDSIMHYPSTAFSKNGSPTILPLDQNKKIGQRVGLSKKDIKKVNRMYNCSLNYLQ